jgi:hypothetical protein
MEGFMRVALTVSVVSFPLFLSVGCGDTTGANGEFGRIHYSLYTDYFSEQTDLTEARIVTGHQQRIYTSLTQDGWNDSKNPESLVHTVQPSVGVSLYQIEGLGGVDDLLVTADAAGSYVFETHDEEELFERITLEFDEPESFELITWTREPYSDDFVKVESAGGSVAVSIGTQASFLPVPLDGAGARLLGDLHANLTADPEDAIVPDYTVKPYEQSVWATPEPLNIYFVLPGDVGITLTDPVSGAASTMNFSVNPLE